MRVTVRGDPTCRLQPKRRSVRVPLSSHSATTRSSTEAVSRSGRTCTTGRKWLTLTVAVTTGPSAVSTLPRHSSSPQGGATTRPRDTTAADTTGCRPQNVTVRLYMLGPPATCVRVRVRVRVGVRFRARVRISYG